MIFCPGTNAPLNNDSLVKIGLDRGRPTNFCPGHQFQSQSSYRFLSPGFSYL